MSERFETREPTTAELQPLIDDARARTPGLSDQSLREIARQLWYSRCNAELNPALEARRSIDAMEEWRISRR